MKKILSAIVSCILLVTLLVGGSAALAESKTVHLQMLCAAEEAKALPALMEIFNKTYPDVTIEPLVAATPDQYNSIMAAKIASKDVPDLLMYQASSVTAMYAAQGIITDLTDTGFVDRISAGDRRRYSYKDRVFSIPMSLGVAGIIVNVDMMKKYGVEDVPKNQPQFIEACKKFQEAGMESPIVIGGKELSPASQYIYQSIYLRIYGSNPNWYIDVLEGKNSWDGAEMQSIFDGYAELLPFMNKDALGLDFNGAIRRLATGEGVYLINNASGLAYLREANPDTEYMVIPPPWTMGPDDDTLANSDYDSAVSISSSTEYPEECLAFVDFLTSKEGAAIFNNATVTYPSVLGANVDLDPALSYCFENYINQKKAIGFFSRQWVPGTQDIMKKSTQDWLGGMDKAQALKQIEDEHKRLMEINGDYVRDFLADNPRQ